MLERDYSWRETPAEFFNNYPGAWGNNITHKASNYHANYQLYQEAKISGYKGNFDKFQTELYKQIQVLQSFARQRTFNWHTWENFSSYSTYPQEVEVIVGSKRIEHSVTLESEVENNGQVVSNETLNKWNSGADLIGWGSNIWGDAAKYTLAGMKRADAATPLIKGIGIGAKTLGYTGMAISLGVDVIRYRQSPTWGNAGRIGVDGFSTGISVAWPGPGTAIGFGTAAVNATGGMEGFYNFLDANQSLYNSTGNIMVPGLNPFNQLTIIKLK